MPKKTNDNVTLQIAIDGACRANGKPDCCAAGGAIAKRIEQLTELTQATKYTSLTAYEEGSSNQRGELLALLQALRYIAAEMPKEAQIITDSEYLFNTMTKEWFKGWISRGWLTAECQPVKNKDLWKVIVEEYTEVRYIVDINMYHIKGHIIPIGEVTARELLEASEHDLIKHCIEKYDMLIAEQRYAEKAEHAQTLSVKNNGFKLPGNVLRDFVALNNAADTIAKYRLSMNG